MLNELQKPYESSDVFETVDVSLIELIDVLFEQYDGKFAVLNTRTNVLILDLTKESATRLATEILNYKLRNPHTNKSRKETRILVASYIKYNVPRIPHTAFKPGLDRLLINDNDEIVLNTYMDKTVKPAADYSATLPFLKLVHDNLCGGQPHNDLEWYASLKNKKDEYRFLITHMARMLRYPEERTMKAPFIVAYKGTGKDLFKATLEQVLGLDVGSSDIIKDDVLNGFNASLSDKLLATWNEAAHMRLGDMTKILESYIASASFAKRAKGSDSRVATECVAYHYFFAPELPQWHIDESERRLYFIRGVESVEGREYATYFAENYCPNYTANEDLLSGLSNYLNSVAIDRKFLNSPPDTPLRQELIRLADVIDEWVSEEQPGGEGTATYWVSIYNNWKKRAYPTYKPMGASSFTKRLKARSNHLGKLGVELEFRRSNGKNLISIINENADDHVIYDDKLITDFAERLAKKREQSA